MSLRASTVSIFACPTGLSSAFPQATQHSDRPHCCRRPGRWRPGARAREDARRARSPLRPGAQQQLVSQKGRGEEGFGGVFGQVDDVVDASARWFEREPVGWTHPTSRTSLTCNHSRPRRVLRRQRYTATASSPARSLPRS